MKRHLPISLLLLALLLPAAAAQAFQGPPCNLNDGRINARPHRDCGAPVAIFIQGGDIVVLGLNEKPGPQTEALRAPVNSPIPTNANTIVAQGTNPVNGRPVILSRLTTGEYQLNTFNAEGVPYIVVWYKGAEDVYHLDPVTGKPLDGAQPIVAPDAPNPSAGSQSAAPAAAGAAAGATTSEAAAVSSLPAGVAVPITNCQVTTTRIVRLRTEPDLNSQIISRLPYRTTYTVTERTADWFRVIYQNTQGWVSAEFVNAVGSCGLEAG
jgi:hypothetical protein